MRMLVVAPQPFFTPRGTPFSVYHRTRITAELGVQVDLLTYGEGQDVDLPGVRIVRIPRIRPLEPVKIGPSVGKALLDVFVLWWTVGLLMRHRYDVVHAHEEAVFFCALLKPLFRFRLVYDMHSSLPQQLTNFGFTRSRLLIGLFERLERHALRSADAVITISPALAEYAVSVLGSDDKHTLIENSLFDPVRVVGGPEEGRRSVAEVDIADETPLIGYAGTFEAYQGIDLLLEAQVRVVRSVPDAILLLIGGSASQVDQYRALAERLDIAGSCRFTGLLPQEEAQRLLARATVVVSPRTRGDNTPLKVYELLASGVPLVATRIGSHTQVLSDAVCLLADPDPDAYAEAIVTGLTDERRRADVVAGARELYRTAYSAESYRKKLRRVLEGVA
jgi:glycosyltransferase involved in cell wall biosynthesis